MKKFIAVIAAIVLMSLWSAGCFAEAGPEGPGELFCHIRDLWMDEEQRWYQTYFAGLGPRSEGKAGLEPVGMCTIGFVLDQERVTLSENTGDGVGIRYAWDGMTPGAMLRLCGEMCQTWKDYEKLGTLRIVVVYEEKGIMLTIKDEEAAQAFLKMPLSDFRAERYKREAEGLCGYILNEWLDGVSPYYEVYFSKHEYEKKEMTMPADDICGVIFVLDKGIIDLLGTDAEGNGVEFEWTGFGMQNMMFICEAMCLNWKDYEELGRLKILLTYAEKDASMMIRDEESAREYMDLFGELYPEAKAMIDTVTAE